MWVEKAFDLNDWVVLISIVLLWGILFLVPRGLAKQSAVLVMLYGLTVSTVFDNSFAAKSMDYYDILDGPAYTVMDFFLDINKKQANCFGSLSRYKKNKLADTHSYR